jgi:two-component system cell cycle response regulator
MIDPEAKTGQWDVRAISPERGDERRNACFIVIAGRDLGKLYILTHDDVLIGRDEECSVCISDESVSRRHARVFRQGPETFVLEDLGSTNGTFCNGKQIQKKVLADGDKVMAGSTTILKFSYQDASEIDFQERLFSSIVRDWLTQAYNKRYFEQTLANEFTYASRHQGFLVLLMFDLDHFKGINDTHGHIAGDFILKEFCRQLTAILRKEESIARFGGEEFVILARGTDRAGACVLAERCRATIEAARFDFEGTVIPLTVSVGVAAYPAEGILTPEDLIATADSALYHAKAGGRNRVETAPENFRREK